MHLRRGLGRRATWLAWGLCTISIVLSTASVVFDVVNWLEHVKGSSSPAVGLISVPLLAYPIVGVLIVARRPSQPIGWMFCWFGLAFSLPFAASGYAQFRAAGAGRHGPLPLADFAAWIFQWLLIPELLLAGTLLLLLFPDGRLASRHWRPVAWLATVLTACVTLDLAISPGLLSDQFDHVQNPVGFEAARTLIKTLEIPLWVATFATLVAAPVSLVLRYRRSEREARLQIKWIAFAGAVFVVVFISTVFGLPGGWVATLVGVGLLPAATGAAILRYRLYDIDRLISRTISYVLVTGVLVGVFVGIVLLATRVLPFSSPVGVAASTLAAAALFTPLRRRVQGLVDRRFNRTRYDAEAVLAAFGDRLRGAVDLESVEAGLLDAVGQATAPAHASIWLRNDPETVTR